MLEILATYQGLVTQAITIGAILGVIGGIVLLTAEDADADERHYPGRFRRLSGMLLYQAVRLDNLTNWVVGLLPGDGAAIYEQGPLFWEAFLRIVQASFLGGVLALIFVARPTLKGGCSASLWASYRPWSSGAGCALPASAPSRSSSSPCSSPASSSSCLRLCHCANRVERDHPGRKVAGRRAPSHATM